MSRPSFSSSSGLSSRSNSTSSLPVDGEEEGAYSSDTSASTFPRAGSCSPVPRKDFAQKPIGFLEPPPSTVGEAWRNFSRSPSPSGLIPVHRTFSKMIHKHEIPRKLLHVSIGFVGMYCYRHGYQPSKIVPVLATALVPIASADVLRFYSPTFNSFYIKVLGALMRESEVRGWNGVVWYLAGTIAVLSIFPKDVATLSILLLSWCDTAASTFGRAWGRYTPQIRSGKSVAGTLGALVVGALTAGIFWGYIVPTTPSWPDDPVGSMMWNGKLAIGNFGEITGGWALTTISLLTGVVASASEVLDLWGIDDNLVIPVVSAVGVWSLLKIFS